MEDLSRAGSAWVKASTNVSNRDKVLRVFQYSSVMLLGFYKNKLSEEYTMMFRNVRSAASVARRSFRLLKYLNHMANMINIFDVLMSKENKDQLENYIYILQEACLASLYYYDNIVFLTRLGIFSYTVEEKNSLYKKSLISWCLGECFKLVAILYRHSSTKQELIKLLCGGDKSDARYDTEIDIASTECAKIRMIERERRNFPFQLSKALCNIALSASLIDDRLIVGIVGRRVFDITTGFLGAATAAIALYENNVK